MRQALEPDTHCTIVERCGKSYKHDYSEQVATRVTQKLVL